MSDVTKATVYNLFADIGDGKLYLMQVFPGLAEAEAFAYNEMAKDAIPYFEPQYIGYEMGDATYPIREIVLVRTFHEEVRRIDGEDARKFLSEQAALDTTENVVALGGWAGYKD